MKYFKPQKPLILYPWLIVVLFVLKKFDMYDLHPAWKDILVFLIMNFIVLFLEYKVLNIFINDRLKTWLLVSISLILFLSYARFFDLLSKWTFFFRILHSLPLILRLLLYLSVFILIIYLSINFKGTLVKTSKYLNVLMISLITYAIFTIFLQGTKKITLVNQSEISGEKQQYSGKKPPDIFYIILDAYTSNQSLKEYWSYNNDELTNFLEKQGFYIAKDSKTNYNLTDYSLCSSLNMSYLTNLPKTRTDNLAYIVKLKKLNSESRVIKYVLENGYRVTNYSFFDLPGNPRYYDDYYFTERSLKIGTIYEAISRKMKIKWAHDNFYDNQLILKTINPDILNKLMRREINHDKPNFVYAHIMMPHDPYLFDEYGRIHEDDSVFICPLKDRYLGQLKYVNKLIINTLKSVFDNYALSPPVIIVQGDHGYRYLSGPNKMKESMTIFNAYYFPDKDYSKIYNSISPVNTFRVLFNKYLNASFPMLKDTCRNIFYY